MSESADQPIKIKEYPNVTTVCNGEIYNCHDLEKEFGIKPQTNSDCEIITHLYKRIGFAETLKRLDGVFGIALYDADIQTVFIGHDPVGIRALYYGFTEG